MGTVSDLLRLPVRAGGALGGMDDQGELILGTYFRGGGKPIDIFDDPEWTAYMQQNEGLRRVILGRLILAVKDIVAQGKKGKFPITQTFHAEFEENRGLSGYALLHGTDRTVGDFKLTGWADVDDANDPADNAFDVELDLRFVFNDIVNPNPKYWTDSVRNAVAELVTLGGAESYRISISWGSSCLAEIRPERHYFFGYPSDLVRGVRPLPRATLDWVRAEKSRAKKIEANILQVLRSNIRSSDVASLADRKRKLLWMFYSLSGYMGGTYLDRFARANSDELTRLVRARLSGELLAELMNALRGKRPHGVEPP
jgi:hypothetical protein